MPKINEQYRIALKPSYYFIELLLVSMKYLIICNDSNEVFNSVYKKNYDFFRNDRIKSHKNVRDQCHLQDCKENN